MPHFLLIGAGLGRPLQRINAWILRCRAVIARLHLSGLLIRFVNAGDGCARTRLSTHILIISGRRLLHRCLRPLMLVLLNQEPAIMRLLRLRRLISRLMCNLAQRFILLVNRGLIVGVAVWSGESTCGCESCRLLNFSYALRSHDFEWAIRVALWDPYFALADALANHLLLLSLMETTPVSKCQTA